MNVSNERLLELNAMPYREYLSSPEWIAFSENLKNKIQRCQLCGGKDRPLQVHHNTYENNRGKENSDDVIVLCDRCHYLYELLISRRISISQDVYRKIVPYSAQELSTLTLHTNQTFDNFDLREDKLDHEKAENLKRAFTFARDFAARPQDWIVFSGDYGCGKTHLAAAIANLQSDSFFVTGSDLNDYLWTAFSPNNPYPYDKCFYELRNAPFLILDDLTNSGPQWVSARVTALVKYRYEARLPTVFTIAKNMDISRDLRSLMLDVSRCIPFEILAPSYRGVPMRLVSSRQIPAR